MEQFDTDEILINSNNNKKNQKKKSNINYRNLILIVICTFIFLFSIYVIFKKAKSKIFKNIKIKKYPILIGDIDEENIYLNLLKLSTEKNIPQENIYSENINPINYTSFNSLLKGFLKKFSHENYPIYAIFIMPESVKNNNLSTFNCPKIDKDELSKDLNINKIIFLNDFYCKGYAIQTDLKIGEDYVIINNGEPQENGQKLIIELDKDLNMEYLVKNKDSDYYSITNSEGRFGYFGAKNKENYDFMNYYKNTLGNSDLSIQKILSEQGLIIIYKYLKFKEPQSKIDKNLEFKINKINNDDNVIVSVSEINKEIINKGINGDCDLSKKVLEYFIGIFGEIASDISLTCYPSAGLYIMGNFATLLEPLIINDNIFMEHFTSKDIFKKVIEYFPVYLVKNKNLGRIGAIEYARRLLLFDNK